MTNNRESEFEELPTLEEIAAERKRVNKLYKQVREAEKARRKPLEDAIKKVLPEPGYREQASRYRVKAAERLAALYDNGELSFKGLPDGL